MGDIVLEAGVVGADAVSGGTRLERIRIGGFLGGSLKSTVVAGRAGGGGAGDKPDILAPAVPGEAVCALGGGGGADDLAGSEEACITKMGLLVIKIK